MALQLVTVYETAFFCSESAVFACFGGQEHAAAVHGDHGRPGEMPIDQGGMETSNEDVGFLYTISTGGYAGWAGSSPISHLAELTANGPDIAIGNISKLSGET